MGPVQLRVIGVPKKKKGERSQQSIYLGDKTTSWSEWGLNRAKKWNLQIVWRGWIWNSRVSHGHEFCMYGNRETQNGWERWYRKLCLWYTVDQLLSMSKLNLALKWRIPGFLKARSLFLNHRSQPRSLLPIENLQWLPSVLGTEFVSELLRQAQVTLPVFSLLTLHSILKFLRRWSH